MTTVHVVDLWSEGDGTFRPSPPDWHTHARCKGQQHLFFNEASASAVKQAKQICAMCPVRRPCLTFATANEEYGVWAGTTTLERGRHKPKGNR
jgi:WhiB family redox-sensing transcriptional regulator